MGLNIPKLFNYVFFKKKPTSYYQCKSAVFWCNCIIPIYHVSNLFSYICDQVHLWKLNLICLWNYILVPLILPGHHLRTFFIKKKNRTFFVSSVLLIPCIQSISKSNGLPFQNTHIFFPLDSCSLTLLPPPWSKIVLSFGHIIDVTSYPVCLL